MAKLDLSPKHLAISKANAQTVAVVAAASFITIFCLVAANYLWGEKNYQDRVTAATQKADTQLKANVKALNALVGSYQGFVNTPLNAIGGSSTGTGDKDGDNAKIVLDALPSKYDFPALTSSLEKILKNNHFNVTSITGTDEEATQGTDQSSSTPQPVAMPFAFTVSDANYQSVQNLITVLQNSIRPIQIDSLTLSGATNNMQLTVNAHTYYQPEKDYKVTTEVVK